MIITGTSKTRLTELRKYTNTNIFENQYISGGSINNNGVDYNNSTINNIKYFIDGIEFSGNTGTSSIFKLTAEGINNPIFINKSLIKDQNKSRLIDSPKIDNDVFIVRQELSIFDKNYRLEHISNLNELITYVGGNFFNIIKNT